MNTNARYIKIAYVLNDCATVLLAEHDRIAWKMGGYGRLRLGYTPATDDTNGALYLYRKGDRKGDSAVADLPGFVDYGEVPTHKPGAWIRDQIGRADLFRDADDYRIEVFVATDPYAW